MSPIDVTVEYVCDCGCGTVIAPHLPRFVVHGWEILESKVHAAGGQAVFVSPSHVATMAKTLAKAYGDPLPECSRDPDPYLVAHFTVQELNDDDLAAAFAEHVNAKTAEDDPWYRALREEYDRRAQPLPKVAG